MRLRQTFLGYLLISLAILVAGVVMSELSMFGAIAAHYVPTVANPVRIQIVSNSATSTPPSPLTITWSQNTVTNNLLVLWVAGYGSNSANITCGTPTGWNTGPGTQIKSGLSVSAVYMFWKIASGSDANPSCTLSLANGWAYTLQEWWGIDPYNALDVTFTAGTFITTSTSVHTAAATTTNATDFILAGCTIREGQASRTIAWDATYTVNFTNGNTAGCYLNTSASSVSSTGSYTPGGNISATGDIGVVCGIAFRRALV